MEHEKSADAKGTWVGYRPDIKILDCTIRDGGLVNDHRHQDGFVKAVYEADVAAGVDYMEMGYKADKKLFAPDKFGAWKYCREDDLRRVVGENEKGKEGAPLKLCAMADAERTDYHADILPREQSVLEALRIATYIHQIPVALDMVKDAHDKGYETMLQLMAVSVVHDRELAEALEEVAKSAVSAVYIVDSFGALYSEQVKDLVKIFMGVLEGSGKEVGFHGHNNQQLAYANTIEALIVGASRLDVTMGGLGRGAGNCPLELLLGFLHNPKFRLRPVLKCVQEVIVPLREELDWGFSVPYMITGQLNRHPRAAIAMRASASPDDYVAFYDEMAEQD